ncbi:Cytochrome c oxidase assembly protein cox18, mitochondrial [Scheffersomyces spartinae]|uniref:Cytochrome c oxidase assembly protein cox18, mitochondrial n=1 Tax=Scheffersomyces spartinae TaxID=45513 RepID=A0A9P7VBA2_9ASCO|nr:Cytochrome c oxidase assembly protein cox18, mitochondrial [Scheffersomyces spartinae]KAG7194757.1 Cytochrome c oxidase assembly protein cox18, mitochondrial [Scheffersomyces spartinae]
MTENLQAVHLYSGIPWWALIPMTTITLRSIWTLPLAIAQRKRIQKQSTLKPLVAATNPVLKMKLAREVLRQKKETTRKTQQESRSSSGQPTDEQKVFQALQALKANRVANLKYEQIVLMAAKETRKRQKKLFSDHGVQMWKNMVLPMFQIPLWVGMSFTFRDLSGWSTWDAIKNKALDPSLYTEGILWFPDLSIADPWCILPVVLGAISIFNVEWTFKTLELMKLTIRKGNRITIQDSLANVARMSVVFMMAISLHAPTALVLYWISSQVFSLVQNIILDLVMPISYTPNRRFNISVQGKEANNIIM